MRTSRTTSKRAGKLVAGGPAFLSPRRFGKLLLAQVPCQSSQARKDLRRVRDAVCRTCPCAPAAASLRFAPRNGAATLVGGTSLSSPLAVGSRARIQTAHKNRLGFAGPLIYQLANG